MGDFLEHSRIFYFRNGGREEVYCGSADWMPRNLDRRVEILFPIEKDTLKQEMKHILELQLADNVKAHVLGPDGNYEKVSCEGKEVVNSQGILIQEAVEKSGKPQTQDE